MSRVKSRSCIEVCADCGSHDPTWASINRGILICDECCSVHRSLGPHISQVKSLKKDTWSPSQLEMVRTLYTNGANNIWEHFLLDPNNAKSGRRKPNPKDPLNPTKADFIRAKHQMFAFVYRPKKDDGQTMEGDVSKQLHSSVRTSNLETCLRLLSLGADPNYFHPEKGTRPIHVAAMAGQAAQVELLVVYGADPGSHDHEGRTPVQHAFGGNHVDLADRIVELQYELTDRLAQFVCGRKPDHLSGQHYIIPEMADSMDLSKLAKLAKKRLHSLSNAMFEELVMDVYDEVERRHTDEIWLSLNHGGLATADRCSVLFLPVNPEYSSTRNQGRQKLARFNTRELTILIIDILTEVKRRTATCPVSGPSSKLELGSDDGEPLYDSVASDDELQEEDHHRRTTDSEVVNQQLAVAEARIQQLLQGNADMKQEISTLQASVQRLMQENRELRAQVLAIVSRGLFLPNGHEEEEVVVAVAPTFQRSHQRPQSMYETREQNDGFPLPPPPLSHASCPAIQRRSKRRSSSSATSKDDGTWVTMDSSKVLDSTSPASSSSSTSLSTRLAPVLLPTQKEALAKTKPITQRIEELHLLAKEGIAESYVSCAEKIHAAVLEMAGIFPENPSDDRVRVALKEVTDGALRLHTDTKRLLDAMTREHSYCVNRNRVAQAIVDRAFDLTKAIKNLITMLN